MTLYFIVTSYDAIGIIERGTKVGWNGAPAPEFDAWRSSHAGLITVVPVHPAEAKPALITGVLDIYVTTFLAEARRVVETMPSAFIYDTNGTVLYADDGPGTPSPTDPVSDNVPTELIIRSELNIDSPTQLAGASIAVVIGSATELTAASFFAGLGIQVHFVVFANSTEAINAFAAGRTDALAVADGFGARIAEQYLGGAARHTIIDLTLDTEVPAHVTNVALC